MPFSSPLASLYTVLQSVCASAETNAALLRKNEAATRAALIDPILRALGWDTANVRMVEPERTIGGELRVDYLLHNAAGNPHIVVEAKCLGASLDKHGYVSKVLGYALGFKVQTVFITDGLQWHCYSNLHKGNTEAITFSLAEGDLLTAALQLIQWLDSAQSGHGITAYPTPTITANQVTGELAKPQKKVIPKLPKVANSISESFIELTQINTLQLEPNQKPKQLRLPDGSIKQIQTWKDILLESCRFVLKHNQNIDIPFPDKAGRKRFLISEHKPTVGSSTLDTYHNKPVFIYTHYSATDCIANALHVIRLAPDTVCSTAVSIAF